MRQSLYLTAKVLCGFDDMTPHLHGRICRWFQDGLDEGEQDFVIIIPRGMFKSSLFSIAFPIWQLIRDPTQRILVAHASSAVSERLLQDCGRKILGDNFRTIFPELVPDIRNRRWNGNEVEIERPKDYPEPSITARGVSSTIVGGHYTTLIFDDLVDNKISESETKMQGVIDFYEHSDPLFVDIKRDIRLVVGTLWPGGFYEKILSDETPGRKLVLGCYKDERWKKFAEQYPVAA